MPKYLWIPNTETLINGKLTNYKGEESHDFVIIYAPNEDEACRTFDNHIESAYGIYDIYGNGDCKNFGQLEELSNPPKTENQKLLNNLIKEISTSRLRLMLLWCMVFGR